MANLEEHIATVSTPMREMITSSTIQNSNKQESQIFFILLPIILIAWIGWKVAHGQYYTSRSPFGFYLGVVGSLMMISAVMGYPLRKRLGFMQGWGAIKHWFRIHMFLGLAGPTLIVFHAAFQVRSPNAGIALLSMLLVVASGVIGRFIYSKIHFGLYGRRATLKALQVQLTNKTEETTSFLTAFPNMETWIHNFERSALKTNRPFPENALHVFGLGLWRKSLEFRCRREFHRAGNKKGPAGFKGKAQEATHQVSTYLREIQRVAQFKMYERFFSLWHVLHIPLIYILAASGIFHVIAVYMY